MALEANRGNNILDVPSDERYPGERDPGGAVVLQRIANIAQIVSSVGTLIALYFAYPTFVATRSAAVPHIVSPAASPSAPMSIPLWALGLSLILAAALNVWATVLQRRSRSQAATAVSAAPLAESAELRLHIYADERQPTRISLNNVWRWYYLRNILVGIDKETGRRAEHITPILFIVFDRATALGTPEVTAGFQLPRYEIKDFSNRSMVIAFFDDLPTGDLTVSVRQ